MKKLLLILVCLPMIGFGQTSWTPCDSSFSININSQNSIEVIYSVSGPNLNMNSNPSWVYFNMLGSCIGGSSYNSQTDTVNINNNLPDSTAIMCLITDSLSSCIVTDTLVFDALSGWFFTSNQSLGCTDIIACNYDALATIDDSSCSYLNISISIYNVSCNGFTDGSVVATANGGATPNYQYSMGGGLSQANGTFSNLSAGTYFIDATDINGCSSNQTFTITEPLTLVLNNNINGCDSVLIGNSYYTISSTYSDTLTSLNGCDSIVNTNLNIEQSTFSYDTLSVSSSIVWNGMPLNISGDYSVTLTNSVGCDSIINLNLTVTTTGISDIANSKSNLVKITDMLGKETPYRRNTTLLYIYDDGTVEKRIVIE